MGQTSNHSSRKAGRRQSALAPACQSQDLGLQSTKCFQCIGDADANNDNDDFMVLIMVMMILKCTFPVISKAVKPLWWLDIRHNICSAKLEIGSLHIPIIAVLRILKQTTFT